MLNDHEGFLSEENVGHQDVFQESWAYYNQMTEACQRRMEVSMTWRTASLNAPGNGKINLSTAGTVGLCRRSIFQEG